MSTRAAIGRRQEPSTDGRILVGIDDDPMCLEVMSAMAWTMGIELRAFPSATAAWDFLSDDSNWFDLRIEAVLCDLMMPRWTGLDLLEKMKQDRRLRSVPFYIVSGADPQVYRRILGQMGADGFFPKPLDLDAIATACRRSK
jgi:chemosensory pili system protein ChpA (sensor histidine kinase/response regulator)